jgi:2-dehydro-3-deoxygluconokinase
MMTYDLVTLGEVLLRLSVPAPARFETAHHLDVQFGGAEANVAAACARLGLRTAWISALPDNAWGERVKRELRSHGVDCSAVPSLPGTRLGVYFLEYGAAPRPIQVLYDRRDSAFVRLTTDMVDWKVVRHAKLVHISGVTPALGDNPRSLVRRVLEEAHEVSFDLNYRAALWTPADAQSFALSVLPGVRYFFLGQTEAQNVFNETGSPEEILRRLSCLAPKATIALLRGAHGSTVLHRGEIWEPKVRHDVKLVDPIGAGDAFVAGYLWAAIRSYNAQEMVDIAATVAALKCSTWGDIALINEREILDALSGGPDVRR